MPRFDVADIGITALGVALSYLVINAALAGVSLEAGNPAASARWWPGYPQAGAMIAEKRFSAGDIPGALKAADWAIERQPLNVGALRTAGLAIEHSAGTRRAEPLMRLAEQRSWRDAPTTAWLLKRDLIERRYSAAVDDADAILRLTANDRALQSPMISLLVIASNLPPFVAPIARQLALRPPWRYAYLAALGGFQHDRGGAEAVLAALKRTDAPPSGFELSPYISRLVLAGDYSDALARWRALSPAAGRDGATLLRDGDFAADPDGTPLDWVMASGAGVTVMVGALPSGSGARGLRVEYDGVSQSPMPRQLLVLQPGSYRLTGTVTTEAAAPGSGLRWSLVCAKNNRIIGQSDAYGGSSGQAALSLDFAVTSDCEGLWLALTPVPGERAADMVVWFSNLAVQPAATGTAAPSTLHASAAGSSARQ